MEVSSYVVLRVSPARPSAELERSEANYDSRISCICTGAIILRSALKSVTKNRIDVLKLRDSLPYVCERHGLSKSALLSPRGVCNCAP